MEVFERTSTAHRDYKNAKFLNCHIFRGNHFENCTFDNCLFGIDLILSGGRFWTDAIFTSCQFTSCTFATRVRDHEFYWCKFDSETLSANSVSEMMGVTMRSCRMINCLSMPKMFHCDLRGSTFQNEHIISQKFEAYSCDFRGVTFAKSVISDSLFDHCDMRDSQWKNVVSICKTRFAGCEMSKVEFNNIPVLSDVEHDEFVPVFDAECNDAPFVFQKRKGRFFLDLSNSSVSVSDAMSLRSISPDITDEEIEVLFQEINSDVAMWYDAHLDPRSVEVLFEQREQLKRLTSASS